MAFEQLQHARALNLPSREAMLQRSPSVEYFWRNNKNLLSNAWAEWEMSKKDELVNLNQSLFDPNLRKAIRLAWEDPTKESAVKKLWHEVMPGVYQCQFFEPQRLTKLREYLEEVSNAQIPLRPPYGIVLNRGGMMLDSRSLGYLAAPSFQAFYRDLIDQYMRPISRLLFPEIMGYDTQSFGFSIQYQPTTDTSIRPHTDASAVTLNINLNLPGEEFSGSAVDFFNPVTGVKHELVFEPGTAVIHRGNVPHAAQPITSGERSNFVFWLYGKHGQIPANQTAKAIDKDDAQKRWSLSTTEHDDYSPF
ncbi:MAG: 2OG-Fe(II) oxygenase family protein [Pseudomonadota bacterium]